MKGFTTQFLDDSQVRLTYGARVDPTGSINTTSIDKANFWTVAPQLFGVSLTPDEGLLGAKMPGPENRQQPLADYDSVMK